MPYCCPEFMAGTLPENAAICFAAELARIGILAA